MRRSLFILAGAVLLTFSGCAFVGDALFDGFLSSIFGDRNEERAQEDFHRRVDSLNNSY